MTSWAYSGTEHMLIGVFHSGCIMGARFFNIKVMLYASGGLWGIDYIYDYIGVGIPSIAHKSFQFLLKLMEHLGLSVSQKKLVPPSTRVTCLGVLIDTDAGTISIPSEKLLQINETVQQCLLKHTCTKRQLQSILGLLLYVLKCVKHMHVFLNHMLEVLRSAHGRNSVTLTSEFRCDLCWFANFLPSYKNLASTTMTTEDLTMSLS